MSTNFEKCIGFILKHEGGYVNHPRDPGGETNMGIAKKFYPDLDIKNLTVAQAKEIYLNDYWLKNKCDQMPLKVALVVFDSTVNQGFVAAAKILQRALRVKDDGIIGSITIAAINRSNFDDLIAEFTSQRALYYANTRNVDTFGLGWYRRTIDSYRFAQTL